MYTIKFKIFGDIGLGKMSYSKFMITHFFEKNDEILVYSKFSNSFNFNNTKRLTNANRECERKGYSIPFQQIQDDAIPMINYGNMAMNRMDTF